MGNVITLIAKNTELLGTVNFSGALEIEGRVIGDVLAPSDSKAKIQLLEQGYIEGKIEAPYIIINGKINGDITSSKEIELSSNAVIDGNVYYNIIEIAKGAKINGSLLYKAEKKAKDKTDNDAKPQAQSKNNLKQFYNELLP